MEPLFRSLVVGLVPRPRQMPPAPFSAEDLQRVFLDVTRDYTYQQFAFLPGGSGAELVNSPEEGVTIQAGLIQVRTRIDLTSEAARNKAMAILRTVQKRLDIPGFVGGGLKIIAHVPAPGASPSARAFVAEHLMRGGNHVEELGPSFFAGGVKYRSIENDGLIERVLLIEPFVQDDSLVFVDFDVQNREAFDDLEAVVTLLDEAFRFVSGETMAILRV